MAARAYIFSTNIQHNFSRTYFLVTNIVIMHFFIVFSFFCLMLHHVVWKQNHICASFGSSGHVMCLFPCIVQLKKKPTGLALSLLHYAIGDAIHSSHTTAYFKHCNIVHKTLYNYALIHTAEYRVVDMLSSNYRHQLIIMCRFRLFELLMSFWFETIWQIWSRQMVLQKKQMCMFV